MSRPDRIGAEEEARAAAGVPGRRRQREFAVLLVRRMRRDEIGADRQHDQQADERQSDDRAAVLRERTPELAPAAGGACDAVGRRACSGSGGTDAQRMPNARVDHAVEHVDDQVDRDDDRRDQQDAALHDRIVARLHAVNQPVADAGPGKDRLGQDRARQQQADLQPDDRDHRNQRVAQRVHDDHAPARQALGARGAHVVLAQHFEHRRARHPRDHRQRNRAERDRRQDQVRQRRAERARCRPARSVSTSMKPVAAGTSYCDGDAARHRRPAELHREEQDQQQRPPEDRHRVAGQRQRPSPRSPRPYCA